MYTCSLYNSLNVAVWNFDDDLRDLISWFSQTSNFPIKTWAQMEVYIFADKVQPGLQKMNFKSRNIQNPFGECQFFDKEQQ